MNRAVSVTGVKVWDEGKLAARSDSMAAEEPLEICLSCAPLAITMRTPGHDLELAAGFLLTEGIIARRAELRSLRQETDAAGKANRVRVELMQAEHGGEPFVPQRNFMATSGCGVCGKASIDSLRVRDIRAPNPKFQLDAVTLCSLPARLEEAQKVFHHTGGLHAAALFTAAGKLLVSREDIGRHNAVDKTVGWALAENRIPLDECMMLVSGRAGFEIVQKALVAGVPLLASISAPSDLAVKLARGFGMTLIGFLRGRRFVVYSGEGRLRMAESVAIPENAAAEPA